MRRRSHPARPAHAPGLGACALLLCCALLAPAWAAAAAAGAPRGEILPGQGVGDIRVGMPVGDVLRLWGLPERMERDPSGVVLYDYGDAKGIGVFVAGDRVEQILVITPEWAMPNGLRVGATRPEVVAFYGRPEGVLQGQSPGEFRYLYLRRGIVFIFKDRSVAGITVLPAATEAPVPSLPPDDPAVRQPFLPAPTPGPRY